MKWKLYNISVILQDELFDNKYLNSINTKNETDYIRRYVTFSEFLISSRIRGEYCFLSVMSEDAGLLNSFYRSTAKEAKKKYNDKVEALLTTREMVLDIVTVDESKTTDTEKGEFEVSNNNNNYESGRVSFGDYSIVVPDNWVYEQSDYYDYFFEKENYKTAKEIGGEHGMVLFITKFNEPSYNPEEKINSFGYKNGHYYYADVPRDVQVADMNNQELIDLHNNAQSQINDVINSFRWETER